MDKVEFKILENLIYNDEYLRKVLPFIKSDYFNEFEERVIFEEITKHAAKYNSRPSKDALLIEVETRRDITESQYKSIQEKINLLSEESTSSEWLYDTTEKWCKDRAIYLALMESIKIADGADKEVSRDAIPDILSKALSVSFDDHIGHDYFNDLNARYEFYNRKEEKIPFDLEIFDKITKGGLPSKTLNIALAGTGVGKSLFMCHLAASVLLQGKNVLYITLEMAEERIAERIDANLLNIPIQDISTMPKAMFDTKLNSLSKKSQGKLIIKEYPTAAAHSGHFKALLNELYLKKNFKPDIVFIDYLNICASSRYKGNSSINSYTYVKSIAEELRGLAVECDFPIVSATQTTRSGYGSSDIDLTDTSESFGLPATADFMFALISTEELENLNQIMVKQLKNRYNDLSFHKRFVVGIDRSRMRLYDVESNAQSGLQDSGKDEDYDFEKHGNLMSKFEGFKF